MLDKMIDDTDFQAGVYATAYRFYDAANMTTYLFAALVLPMFAANFNDNKVLGDLYNIAVRLVIVVSVIISTVLFTFSNELIDVLLDNYDQQSIAVLKILSITYLIMSISYILGSLMIAKNNLRKLNYLFLGGIIVNVLLNGIFISRFEAIGAAFATLITQTMILIGQYIIVFYETKLKLELLTLVKIIGYALLTILFSHYVQISFSFGVIYKLIIIITFALLFALSLRLILRSDLGRVYKI
jgi:O-antigen/teichoic acid export membrane protein